MHGYFDVDEPEAEQPRRDRELRLGAGGLLGLVFGLVLVCGLCFGVGYATGHHASARSATANAPTPAPDQEPLQGNNALPKPSAAEQTAPQTGDVSGTPAEDDGTNPTTSGSAPGAKAGITSAEVQPVLPDAGDAAPSAQGGAAPNAQSALPPQVQLMVQIAAVRNADDADVLETALRRHGYAVTTTREPADGLIHVRIGPFTSRDEANHWRDKLLGDGYNALVQP
ncbi:MAG: SPOR domain-containing protein [Terracidiphilus sp.]|jgi:cell division septation protein DedD